VRRREKNGEKTQWPTVVALAPFIGRGGESNGWVVGGGCQL
jgi:hypothetical protein